MTAAEFVAALDAENQALLRALEPDATLTPEVKGVLNVPNLLKVALRNEAEATLIAARWLAASDDIQLMLSLARQAADEAKHYELGRKTLLRLATTPETQAAARRAARRTLELADELQKKALATAGIHHAPGC